jgi:hypothetical protein
VRFAALFAWYYVRGDRMALRYEPDPPPRSPERVQEAIAAHRTPRQRLHAALQTMAKDGLLNHEVSIDRFVDDIFGPPGVRAPTDGVTPGRRI